MIPETAVRSRCAGGPYHSTDEIEALIGAFEDTTLAYRRWTHGAHLTVGMWYLLWYGGDDAVGRVGAGIRRYNTAHADEPMRVGYHETMTRFWLWMIADYLGRTPVAGSLADLANGLIAAYVDRELPFRYYSRDRLMSDTARAAWVEPDLCPLPELRRV
jgi:hypothetical protein